MSEPPVWPTDSKSCETGLPEYGIPANERQKPHSDKRGGLKGSTQHWPAVYPPEFEIPRFVVAGY